MSSPDMILRAGLRRAPKREYDIFLNMGDSIHSTQPHTILAHRELNSIAPPIVHPITMLTPQSPLAPRTLWGVLEETLALTRRVAPATRDAHIKDRERSL